MYGREDVGLTDEGGLEAMAAANAFGREEIIALLSANTTRARETIRSAAEKMLLKHCGDRVYYRGLIEFSNVCARNCRYCGIRGGNTYVKRYTLSYEEILAQALWCAEQGYGSVVLQSGERCDREFVEFVIDTVRVIKNRTRGERLPDGLGVTLCVGEQSRETYERFFEAGAHRYLLRIETTSPRLFSAWHPPEQSLENRIACLQALQSIGFQVGTGVMIGVPGQSIEDLADDVLFMRDLDVDMVGMGPYIPHKQTPLGEKDPTGDPTYRFESALLMIAVVRLVMKDVNIAATTALQALDPQGREHGLAFGANVIMPQLTPTEKRKDYLLYEGKPCVDETATQCKGCLAARIASVGRVVGYERWGDSVHFARRRK
ncbi:MAG: [FeFe] hydrogenase H-cluster radical SAM maturase HydE [Chitinivibrionales bacterium]|nr:[FeFe] hydrogenase H-cluster radical SAM maturase HydE [Chitinivibrionales bacterium]MBD3357138.1 [FeFe] hydrogenase H-cluster radical SAM maturase HydE [Chitinivibrionales bacterium]